MLCDAVTKTGFYASENFFVNRRVRATSSGFWLINACWRLSFIKLRRKAKPLALSALHAFDNYDIRLSTHLSGMDNALSRYYKEMQDNCRLEEVVLKAMDDAFTIQISGNLVKQLADDSSKVKKKTRKPKPKPKTPKAPQQDHIKPTIHEDSQPLKGVPPVAGWPPMYLPIPPPANAEVDAIRSVLQESERVLEKLEKKEEEMVVEVTQKAKELRDKEFKLPQPKPMPCLTDLTACLDCYKENTKDPLKCSALVKNFADCARTLRQQFSPSNQ
ncbi:hypothetical protein QVD17_02050 [Tagetes erecta]|uniref:Uncharacterized protein n=1 Tax=Tagetes erecta TaxID=13708 RepID=A0AAD8LBW2_TARER|nr:hypothetical protein QVD17_02050 [Tagetes erecta]